MIDCILAGLGNPGAEYTHTRHNLGFRLLDAFVSQADPHTPWVAHKKQACLSTTLRACGKSLLCVKPQAYMNLSGVVLQSICSYYKVAPSQLIVVYDDAQLALGTVKISLHKGAGGHKGVQNILEYIGSGFIAFRVGLGPKPPLIPMADYVLARFTDAESALLDQNTKKILQTLNLLIDKGPIIAMNTYS